MCSNRQGVAGAASNPSPSRETISRMAPASTVHEHHEIHLTTSKFGTAWSQQIDIAKENNRGWQQSQKCLQLSSPKACQSGGPGFMAKKKTRPRSAWAMRLRSENCSTVCSLVHWLCHSKETGRPQLTKLIVLHISTMFLA